MKTKAIVLSTILFFTLGCGTSNVKIKSDIEKAKESISEYVQANFNDPKSYESIGFGELKKRIDYSESYCKDTMDLLFMKASMDIDSTKPSNEKDKALFEKTLERIKSAKKEFVGYELSNKCRAKNSFGALVVNTNYYTFDTIFKIIKVENEAEHVQRVINEMLSN